MATKTKSTKAGSSKRGKKKGGPIIAGAPIIIGGGGGRKHTPKMLYCDFDEAHYPKRTGGAGAGKKWFRSDVLVMKTLTLRVGTTTLDLTSFLPANGDCKIKIQSIKGGDEEILIYGNNIDGNGYKMGLKFHTGKYLPDARGRRRHSSNDPGNYIEMLKIEAPNWYFDRRFAQGDDWELTADVLPLRRRANRRA